MQFESKYEYSKRPGGNWCHTYSCVTALGGVHLWIAEQDAQFLDKHGGDRYYGGLEGHWRFPVAHRPPDLTNCWLLKGPCWTDGSTLALESWLPIWEASRDDPQHMLQMLENDAVGILEGKELLFGGLIDQLRQGLTDA